MKADAAIIKTLNASLKFEITTIHQAFLQARISRHWGLGVLDGKFYSISIAAMNAADRLIDRILFLEAMPLSQAMGRVLVGNNVEEMMDCELKLMSRRQNQLIESIGILENHCDYESRSMLVQILDETEEYVDWLETQSWLIGEMGLENYIQSQIGEM